MEHCVHDHSAHSDAQPTTPYAYVAPAHGTWEGHVLPGSFFLIWSSWWFLSNFRCGKPAKHGCLLAVSTALRVCTCMLEQHDLQGAGAVALPLPVSEAGSACCIRSTSVPRAAACRLYLRSSTKFPYSSRSWYEWPWRPRLLALEPWLKVLLPFLGINMELWAGHVSYRSTPLSCARAYTLLPAFGGPYLSFGPAQRQEVLTMFSADCCGQHSCIQALWFFLSLPAVDELRLQRRCLIGGNRTCCPAGGFMMTWGVFSWATCRIGSTRPCMPPSWFLVLLT